MTEFYLQITPCLPQSITALWLVLILPSHGGQKAESTSNNNNNNQFIAFFVCE